MALQCAASGRHGAGGREGPSRVAVRGWPGVRASAMAKGNMNKSNGQTRSRPTSGSRSGGGSTAKGRGGNSGQSARGESSGSIAGKQLVIVESPSKARNINQYLGPDYVVRASVGHVRDLPEKAPKGSKQPVPGVDLEHDFRPTYEVVSGKKKTVGELKKLARQAADVWFATDLDREG